MVCPEVILLGYGPVPTSNLHDSALADGLSHGQAKSHREAVVLYTAPEVIPDLVPEI